MRWQLVTGVVLTVAVAILFVSIGATGGVSDDADSSVESGSMLDVTLDASESEVELAVEREELKADFDEADSNRSVVYGNVAAIETHAASSSWMAGRDTSQFVDGEMSSAEYVSSLVVLNAYAEQWDDSKGVVQGQGDSVGIEAFDGGVLGDGIDPRADALRSEHTNVIREAYFDASDESWVTSATRDGKAVVRAATDDGEVKLIFSDETYNGAEPEVSQLEALEEARSTIDDDWMLVDAEADTTDGTYQFHFALQTNDESGSAVIIVDAENGEVVHMREGVGDAFDEDHNSTVVPIIHGEFNENSEYEAEVVVFQNGSLVDNAEVYVGDEKIGVADGQDSVTTTIALTEDVSVRAVVDRDEGVTEVELYYDHDPGTGL